MMYETVPPESFWAFIAWALVVFVVGLEWLLGAAVEWWQRPRKEDEPWK